MQHGGKKYIYMGHSLSLNLICDIGENCERDIAINIKLTCDMGTPHQGFDR